MSIEEKENIRVWWAGGDKLFNYGDAMGKYLVEKMTGKNVILSGKKGPHRVNLVIGSIINNAGTTKYCDVWGCGIISRGQTSQKGAKFYAVRGPLTRQSLLKTGHHCPEIYGDPALLLPKYYTPKTEKKYEIGIIPHYVDYQKVKKKITDTSICIIDLMHKNIEETTDKIFSCKRIISSSLHGIIVAQSYNIPALWTKFSNKLSGDGVKFADYFLSVGINPYNGINMINEIPNRDKIINLIDDNSDKTKIVEFNEKKLLDSCPFKINKT